MSEWIEAPGVDDACTLPSVERPVRQAEFDQVFAQTEHVEVAGPGAVKLHLRREASTVALAAELAAKESECCSFFEFNLSIGQQQAVLTVTAPGHHDVITAFARRATQHIP